MAGLIALAWMAQYSAGAAKSPPSGYSIMIGPWTISGWEIYALESLFVILIFAFVTYGIYLFRSGKNDG